jgi:hypothetical protein
VAGYEAFVVEVDAAGDIMAFGDTAVDVHVVRLAD